MQDKRGQYQTKLRLVPDKIFDLVRSHGPELGFLSSE